MTVIGIGADSAGEPLKTRLAAYLEAQGYEVIDYGNAEAEGEDYPDVAEAVSVGVLEGRHPRGLLVCGTGLGMAITANKVPGVRAVTAHDPYSAERARMSNNAQIITMGARVIAPETAEVVLQHWLEAEFDEGGRSAPKVAKVDEVEQRHLGG